MDQTIIINQRKIQPQGSFETPSNSNNGIDISINNQSVNNENRNWLKSEPPTNKNLLDEQKQQFPFIYGPVENNSQKIDSFNIQNIKPKPPSLSSILFPNFEVKSVNFVVFVLLATYFIITILYFYFGPYDLIGCALYSLGAKFTPNIRYSGEVHRLIVSIPLFGGIYHAAFGLLTIVMFGFVVEESTGHFVYLLFLFASGFLSNLFSAVAYPYYVTVGSVGLIFGLLTQYAVWIHEQESLMGSSKNLKISLFILMLGGNLLALVDCKAIDIAGIFGGIIGSALLSVGLSFRKREGDIKMVFWGCLLLYFSLVIILLSVLFTLDVDQINIDTLCR